MRVSIAICCIALLGTASELGLGAQSGNASAIVGPQVLSALPPFSGTDQFGLRSIEAWCAEFRVAAEAVDIHD